LNSSFKEDEADSVHTRSLTLHFSLLEMFTLQITVFQRPLQQKESIFFEKRTTHWH